MSTATVQAGEAAHGSPEPVGTINVFDPHPLNWLFVTWNTMEEPIRTDHEGFIVMALAEAAIWRSDAELEIKVREGARFQDGSPPR